MDKPNEGINIMISAYVWYYYARRALKLVDLEVNAWLTDKWCLRCNIIKTRQKARLTIDLLLSSWDKKNNNADKII